MKETRVRVKHWPSVPKSPWIVSTHQGNRYFKNEAEARAFAAKKEIDLAEEEAALAEEALHLNKLAQVERRAHIAEAERRAYIAERAANSLRSTQRKRQELRQEVEKLERRAAMLRTWGCLHYGYPEPPQPSVVSSKYGDGLPGRPGIYFVWRDDRIQYVGQSVNLNHRARLRYDGTIKIGDKLSWLPLPLESLYFAEAFYIGILRPERNFGHGKNRAWGIRTHLLSGKPESYAYEQLK